MKRGNKRLAGVLAAASLAITAAMIGSAATARADVIPPPAPTWSEIFNPFLNGQNITLCADDPSGSTAQGQWMQLWRCHGYASNGAPQRWYFLVSYVQDGSGNWVPRTDEGHLVYEILNLASGNCLDREDGTLGNPVTLRTCDNNNSELWWELDPTPLSSTAFELSTWPRDVPQYTPECVSASNFTDRNGTGLVKELCDFYDTSQLWSLG
jgi:hypothetical protein